VDHSLDNLRLALVQTASAQTLEETQSAKSIIDYALISEITAYKMDAGNLAGLTHTRNIMTKGKSETQVKDMESALKEIIQRREKERGIILTSIDKFIDLLKNIENRLERTFIVKKPKIKIMVDTSLLDEAKAAEDSHNLPQAIESYKLFIASYPEYENIDDIRLRLAYCYEKAKDYPEAQKLYERITKISAGTKEALIAKASLVKLKDIQGLFIKIEQLTARIKLLKTTADLQDTYYQLGAIYTKLMDLPAAQESYKKVVELDPHTELALKAKFNLGWVYKLENKIEESSNIFQEIASESPKSELAANSKFQVADNLKMQNRYEEALNLYKQMSGEYKDKAIAREAQFQAGYTYLYDLKNPDAAKGEFDKVSPNLAKKIIKDMGLEDRLKGYDLLKAKSYTGAMGKFKTALGLNPKDTAAYVGISRVQEAMGNLEQAIETAEKASQVNPRDEYIFATLGDLYYKKNKYSEAINAYRRAVEIRGDYVEVLYNLGFLYAVTEQYDGAIEALEKAAKIMPSYIEVYNNLGVAYWNKGRAEEAIVAYEVALKLKPDYLDALRNLGLVYKSQGRIPQARDMFTKILSINPLDVEAKKELESLMNP
jgi:superkiller protein 3